MSAATMRTDFSLRAKVTMQFSGCSKRGILGVECMLTGHVDAGPGRICRLRWPGGGKVS